MTDSSIEKLRAVNRNLTMVKGAMSYDRLEYRVAKRRLRKMHEIAKMSAARASLLKREANEVIAAIGKEQRDLARRYRWCAATTTQAESKETQDGSQGEPQVEPLDLSMKTQPPDHGLRTALDGSQGEPQVEPLDLSMKT
ncbi:hypothetical protein ACOMHN_039619 [Nucella lapillus]